MEFTILDSCVLVAYVVVVVALAMFMSRRKKSSEDYFLAGRNLSWWLIGLSLIATDLSLGHFLAGAGAGYETGLALAGFEWMGAVVIVLVAVFLLPKLLRSGIYTIPEYLEHRFSAGTRGLMALYMMLAYVFVVIAAVLYAGAAGLEAIFGQTVKDYVQANTNLDMAGTLGPNWFLIVAVWVLGIIAGLYTLWGGLKAVVWADLLNGLALIAGGVLVTVLGLVALGGLKAGAADMAWYDQLSQGTTYLFQNAGEKLSAVMPFRNPTVPWVAVFIGGMWVPLLFHWGLNQSIAQRALGARSVSQGQKGMMLAASLKLLTPFLIIVPGVIAFELYGQAIANKKGAYPHMLQHILHPGIAGLVLAVLFGAVISTLDSMLNSAATIFTVDFYKRHLGKNASDRAMVRSGRLMTALLVVLACAWAPTLGWICGDKGILDYVQKTWGLLAPGVVTVFLFGLIWRRVPAQAAAGALLLGPGVYASCLYWLPQTAFLHHMAFTFIILSLYTFVVTLLTPLPDADGVTDSSPQRPAGFLRQQAIPFLTTAVGGFLLAWPVLHVGFATTWQLFDVPEWVNFIPAGVVIVVYVILAMYVLRLPAPAARPVTGEVRKRSAAKGLGRMLGYGVAGLLAAVVVGLHAYLFAAWVMPADAESGQPFWRQAYDVTVPQLSIDDKGVHVEGSFQVEKTLNVRPQQEAAAAPSGAVAPTDQAPGPGAVGPMGKPPAPGEAPAAGPGARKPGARKRAAGKPAADKPEAGKPDASSKPKADDEARDGDGEDKAGSEPEEGEKPEAAAGEQVAAKVAGAPGAGEKPQAVMVLLGPLAVGLVAAVLSLLAVLVLWWQPAAAATQMPTTEKIDLAPSVLAKLWGLLIIAATVALFVWFF